MNLGHPLEALYAAKEIAELFSNLTPALADELVKDGGVITMACVIAKHFARQPATVITIPLLPPSVNATVRGEARNGRLNPEHKKFLHDVCVLARGKRAPVARRLDVEIRIYMAPRPWVQVPDVDNLPKLVLDGLKLAEVFPDDRDISDLTVRRRTAFSRREERTVISLREAADLAEEIY